MTANEDIARAIREAENAAIEKCAKELDKHTSEEVKWTVRLVRALKQDT